MISYKKNIKPIWTRTEDLKNTEFDALPVYDGRFIKNKIKMHGDKVSTKFRGLSVPDDGVQCKSFTVISIASLLVYESKYYLQVYLDNWAYKIVVRQMIYYPDDNLF